MSDQVELSVVIPAYDERVNLADNLVRISEAAAATGVAYEIVVVDDGSRDGTWELLREAAARDRCIRGISLSRNFGKEAAILAGLESTRGRAVVIMDIDLQHPPELIAQMHRLWKEQGYDVVNAVKERRQQESYLARIGARVFYRLFAWLTHSGLANSSDFKLLDRRVVDVYCNLPERNRFFRGLVSWLGFRQVSIPFAVAERASGRSKWSFAQLAGLAVDALVSFSTLPLRAVTVVGLIFLVLAFFLSVHTVVLTLMGSAAAGFPTVILLLLIVSSLLMLSLGVIGEYVAKIYAEVKSRPVYLVRERTDAPQTSVPSNQS